ncbi:hypothetical protein LPB67_09355 [Undibacterium sp. Jales W-56]|uniref:hypothetical protein n=1 Tax=Undibacterium sp. Jales W-56 TaxID=2897325 RepID=UPI0021CF3341|nr:hypothetical protein [Undibacterium sp. Jales W-56]MCU6433973.1 hypothetical protein [Undibacterium sp. Jales W-56]
MNKVAGLILVSLALAGCATPPTVNRYFAKAEVVILPAIDVDAEAEIGQNIVSKAYRRVYPAIRIDQDLSDPKASASGTLRVRAGVFRLDSENESGKFFIAEKAETIFLGKEHPNGGGVFVPSDTSKPAVVYGTNGVAGSMTYMIMLGAIPVTNFKHTTYEKWDGDSFKRELVYTGISQNTISVLYREFSDGTARPAFSQDLKYDLSQGDTIGYRGARFQVIKASNTNIRYKVIKTFD